ncbi:unnamed protein product [Mycena citricolor]|uniref:NAD(P)-binding protein n=1 Tax=Mycena citricolor TaxID=2018698 RepID=A0AAD2HLY2_9AGAR|nr:unnamed protein product [Mycena citricolor]
MKLCQAIPRGHETTSRETRVINNFLHLPCQLFLGAAERPPCGDESTQQHLVSHHPPLILHHTISNEPSTMSAASPKVAVVTGAAQGIGRGIASKLSSDGLAVVVVDLPTKLDALTQLVDELGGASKALALACDVSSEEQVQQVIDQTVQTYGRLDVMVANAGIAGQGGSVAEANVSEWEDLWHVNIRGTLLCYKLAAQQMIKQGWGGRIIGASSVAGQRGIAGLGAYSVSKAAVKSLTQTSALELREHKITVNAYAPGLIETPMTVGFMARRQAAANLTDTRKYLGLGSELRVGTPAEIAALVSYLVSDAAWFVTGQTISIDDGAHL